MVFSPEPTAAITRWWHIRHAPVPNPKGHIYGQTDPLADTSNTPAFAALARALPADPVWVISTLQRTRQTADSILSAQGRVEVPSSEPDLVEQCFGEWQGRSPQDAYAAQGGRHPFWLCPGVLRPPGGESFLELMGRVHPTLVRLSRQHANRDVVAVTHGGVIRAAIALALDLSAETALRFSIDNLSITRIDYIDTGNGVPLWRVIAINRPPAP
ncbi:MAG: histidine phosphatase family protein [Rhodospirillaceae bacterium]|nr:histidine phosphatase family protein [Rhodospirillaceae bacterium]